MEHQLDLESVQFYIYAAVAAGVLVVVAIVLSLLPIGKIKIPTIVLSSVSCLVAGIALGLLILALFGYRWGRYNPGGTGPMGGGVPPAGGAGMAMGGAGPGGGGGAPGKMGPGGGGPGGGGALGGPGGGGPGGGRGPSPKVQLANLVDKLELLTRAPLKIDLNDEQRAKIKEQLEGLAEADDLPAEEAQKRLDALLVIIKNDHDTLEAVGFRVSQPRPGPSGQSANPFREDGRDESLKKLKERVTKDKPKT